jgi:hypothetical protein
MLHSPGTATRFRVPGRQGWVEAVVEGCGEVRVTEEGAYMSGSAHNLGYLTLNSSLLFNQ